MSAPDWKALSLSIQRCNAAYIVDPAEAAAAFAALGCVVIGQYRDDSHQAVLWKDAAGHVTLTISGTRISNAPIGDRVGDFIRDLDWTPVPLAGSPSAFVAYGAWDGMDKMVAWMLQHIDIAREGPIDVEGHSLGGWRTPYVPIILKPGQVRNLTRWEPPKAGNAAFWGELAGRITGEMITVVNGNDPWFAWPWECRDYLIQPPGASLLWLHDGKWDAVSEWDWPGIVDPLAMRFSDHEPEVIMPLVDKLAAAA